MESKEGQSKGRLNSNNHLHSKAVNSRLAVELDKRVEALLKSKLSPQKRRLIEYIRRHENPWTYELARDCAVGYPPNRLGELNRDVLPKFGLLMVCYKPKDCLVNRYGDKTHEHRWCFALSADNELGAAS